MRWTENSQAEEIPGLHWKASEWFEAHGFVTEAINKAREMHLLS